MDALGLQAHKTWTNLEEIVMVWTSPRVVEICVGMEINSYATADL